MLIKALKVAELKKGNKKKEIEVGVWRCLYFHFLYSKLSDSMMFYHSFDNRRLGFSYQNYLLH